MGIATTELSKHRQRLRQLIDKINELSFYCAYSDPLIQGTPGEVFRTCGQKSCQCAQDPSKRHGPYMVIQIYQEKKQRQMALKKEEREIWEKAKNYQKQMQSLLTLKKECAKLCEEVRTIIHKRVEKWPK